MHALKEIKRALVPGGHLIDLRPVLDQWPVEVAWKDGFRETGRLKDLPSGLADDQAANLAMEEAARRKWFLLEQAERFSLFYSWDRPSEMEAFIREEWNSFAQLDDQAMRRTKSAWAVAGGDAYVRVRASMMINCWRKAS